VLFTIGILLCFTGIGTILGVPLILSGLLAPLLGPLLGLGVRHMKGNCPWCGTPITCSPGSIGVDYPACKKRIVIRDKQFIGID